MAALAQLAQEIMDPFRSGYFFCVTRVERSPDGSDTVVLPEGIHNVAHCTSVREDSADAALTMTSITQAAHPQGVTLTVGGGTTGAIYYIISMHIGNPAGL
jgi:hypothetical protein